MFESIREAIADLLEDPTERLIIIGAFLLCVIAVLVYVTIALRRRAMGNVPNSSDHLTDFREMYESGKISEFEYRRVRSRLGKAVQREVKGQDSESPAPHDSEEKSS